MQSMNGCLRKYMRIWSAMQCRGDVVVELVSMAVFSFVRNLLVPMSKVSIVTAFYFTARDSILSSCVEVWQVRGWRYRAGTTR